MKLLEPAMLSLWLRRSAICAVPAQTFSVPLSARNIVGQPIVIK